MQKQPISSDFFVAGGALKLDTLSYVTRPADDELLQLALAGQFCYVLTPRQMGKSSLMSRTNEKLQALGVKTAIIDVTRVGPVTVEQWYLSLLTRFQRQLGLSIKPYEWWQAHAFLGPVQRFTDFLRNVILTEIETESVVIFIDEIDATLKFEFRDAFFAAIRAMYNARPNDPTLNRLTFILLGVASPSDLIKDRTLTPFNIGQGIALDEFTKREAKILQNGLEAIYPSRGEALFDRIYYWTNGYPYLTQKLCLAVAQSDQTDWTDAQIDALVDDLFLSEAARKDSNLQLVQNKTLRHPKRRQLLNLYKRVYQGERVANDGQSIIQNQLKLSGLLKEEGGYLHTRNNIYTHVFDLAWVKENTAIDWTRIFAGAAALVAIVAVGVLIRVWPKFGK